MAAATAGGAAATGAIDPIPAYKKAQKEKYDRIVADAKAELASMKGQIGVAFQDGPPHGVLVTEIRAGKACELAGMQVNDVIVYCKGIEVTSNEELKDVAAHFVPGDTIPFTVQRGDAAEVSTLNVLVGSPNKTKEEIQKVGCSLSLHVTSFASC